MKKVIVPGLVLYSISSSLGLFLSRDPFGFTMMFWLAGYVLLAFAVFYTSFISPDQLKAFPYLTLGVILLNFVMQVTGGIHSSLWPAYFLFTVLIAAFSRHPLGKTYAAVGLILGIETANLVAPKQVQEFRWEVFAGYALSLAGVSLVTAHIMNHIRSKEQRVREAHEQLLARADAYDPLSAETRLDGDNRQLSSVSAARKQENAFAGLIDMIYEFVPAHTYALFLKELIGRETSLVLKARRSDSGERSLLAVGEKLTPESIISGCARYTQPQYLANREPTQGRLGYYTQPLPVRSLLVIPIVLDDETIGVLAVDSLEAGAFSLETQDMLSRFTPFFIQIIDKIRVSQELDMRAKHFKEFHNMSSVLNSSLELGEILDRLANEINMIVPHDFCVFVQFDDKHKDAVLVHQSGVVTLEEGNPSLVTRIKSALRPETTGGAPEEQRFPVENSAILSQMLRQWEQGQSAPYHFPDPGDQGREIGLFDDATRLTRPLRSLSCWRLAAGRKFIGAFFIGAVQANAFSEYQRNFLDTLMNQVAVVMDNAILHRQIKNMAHTDGLTGLLNHRTFMEKMDEEFKRLDRAEYQHFSLLLFDIDHFKKVNDEHGHPVGDVALKAVAGVIRQMARSIDFVARYGGEEFAIGMVGADTAGAKLMAERIRKTVESTVITAGAITLKKTVSIGVASYYQGCGKKEVLIAQTDQALYHAKHTGRNKVCLYSDVHDADAAALSDPKR